MLWIVWVLFVLGIIMAKVFFTRTMIRVRFKMEEMKKQLAKTKMDDKVSMGNLEIARRGLAEVQRMIASEKKAIDKLGNTITSFQEKKRKKTEETKKRILG